MGIVTRTIKLRLAPSSEQQRILTQTQESFTHSFNEVCLLGWESKQFNGVELHKLSYHAQREKYNLPSQLAISARMKATEALASAKVKLRKKKKVSCPFSISQRIRYDQRSYTVWFERNEVSILTLEGRTKIPFKLANYYAQFTSWDIDSAELIKDRKARWWLNIAVSKEITEPIPSQNLEDIVGVDLGINNPAADSRGIFYGSTHWKTVQDRNATLRSALQSKGTRSAKRKLKKISGRERRFRRDCDHVLSRRIVDSVSAGDVLVFEDLTDIRSRVKMRKAQRKRLHSWSFSQLQSFVSYKAHARGIHVDYVDPRYTSQKCSKCGHTDKSNRPSQAEFKCVECGFEYNADLNAALNIRMNYIKSKGLFVNQPIVAAPCELVTSPSPCGRGN